MKTLLLISALFFGQFASGQYQIDPKVQHEFDSLFRKQPKDIKKKRYIKGVNDSFALLVEIREDTLNSKEFTLYIPMMVTPYSGAWYPPCFGVMK
jgi:hypothetical protein